MSAFLFSRISIPVKGGTSVNPFEHVTRRVFVGKYLTGRRKHFRLYKLNIFLIRTKGRVGLAMSV